MEAIESQPLSRRVPLPALENKVVARPDDNAAPEEGKASTDRMDGTLESGESSRNANSSLEDPNPPELKATERHAPAMPKSKGGSGREYPYPAPVPVTPGRAGALSGLRSGSFLAGTFEALSSFKIVKATQLACVIYIMVLTFAPTPIGLVDANSGYIVDTSNATNTAMGLLCADGICRPVVAKDEFQMAFLAVSRASAFSLYPVMILAFLSKCKATLNFLAGTRAALYIYTDMHKLHHFCGHYIAYDALIHTVFHLLRWGCAGNISLLWSHTTGISGLVVVTATLLITMPMLYLRNAIRYEIRKLLHALFFVFAVGLCFHVPPEGIPNGGFLPYALSFCIVLYTLDALYIELRMTEQIETTDFHVLPSGVQMTMDVSPRFQGHSVAGGYAYVCIPWVDRSQWHAFSLFEDPEAPARRLVFMQKGGDWTSQVHEALQQDTVRPVWVRGPFLSPYKAAAQYDNQVLVASGIGITPALSVIRAHKATRRVNLVWAVRDPHMLEFFLDRFELDNNAWNLIFYTGKEPLNPILEELRMNTRIIKKRPNLYSIVPNIIYSIESREALPEQAIQVCAGPSKFSNSGSIRSSPSQKIKGPSLMSSLSQKTGGWGLRSLMSQKIGRRKNRLEVLQAVNAKYEVSFQMFDSTPEDDEGNQAFVSGLSPDIKARWGILYCGGSKPVEKALHGISARYKIRLDTESFAW